MTNHDIETLFKLCYIGKQKMGTKEREKSGCVNETIQLLLILLVSALFSYIG
jgi:hypothetical protein